MSACWDYGIYLSCSLAIGSHDVRMQCSDFQFFFLHCQCPENTRKRWIPWDREDTKIFALHAFEYNTSFYLLIYHIRFTLFDLLCWEEDKIFCVIFFLSQIGFTFGSFKIIKLYRNVFLVGAAMGAWGSFGTFENCFFGVPRLLGVGEYKICRQICWTAHNELLLKPMQ